MPFMFRVSNYVTYYDVMYDYPVLCGLITTGPTSISTIRKEVSFQFTTQPVVVFLFQVSTYC